MERFLRRLSLFCLCAASASLAADPLDSVIAPHFGASYMSERRPISDDTEALVSGYRYSFRVDFMSLSSNVSINLLSGFGAEYMDFGAQFRLFDMIRMGQESRSGLLYGAGVGFSYSPGFNNTQAQKIAFIDTLVTAYLRMQWDTRHAWGLFTELAYEGVLQRSVLTKPAQADKSSTHRAVMSIGVPFEVDL